MNKNYLVNDGILKLVDFVNVSSKGNKTINAKNTYLLNLALKGLELKSIGCNFVIDTEYKHDFTRLTNNTECHNSRYDKNSNSINVKDLVNVLNLVNLFLTDRQLLVRRNDKQNLILTVVTPKASLILGKSIFKREKNSSIVTMVESYDLVNDKITEEEEKTKSGISFFTEEDKNSAWNNFLKVNDVIKDFTKSIKPLEEEKKEVKNA